VFNLRVGRGAGGGGGVVVFMVDHDSRKRVAKNFRHFFFKISYFYFSRAPRSRALNFFFFNFSQKFFKDSTRRRSSSSQQPAAASSNAK
jgi:hypothetical protein